MDESLRRLVRERAADVCEYCRLPRAVYPVAYHVEHVIALQHRGPTRSDNLAWACTHCNAHKGPNIAGLDPDTGRLTRLFHPRTDVWADHFVWSGHMLTGRSDIGRTTVAVLAMNSPAPMVVRVALLLEGDFPPPG